MDENASGKSPFLRLTEREMISLLHYFRFFLAYGKAHFFLHLCLESSQYYMGNHSPADVLSDDEENGGNLHISNGDEDDDDGEQTSPHDLSASDYNNNQTINGFSPRSQTKAHNGLDDMSSSTTVIKVEQENEFNCSTPSPPSTQTLTNKNSLASSSAASKRLTGTLNRLLHSAINRPNGHHYHHPSNGVSSSPSASSSSATVLVDSTAKEPKTSLETNTQAIESTRPSPLFD